MPVKVYLNEKFSHEPENAIFDELILRLDEQWGNSDDLVVVLGNFNCNAHEIDAMVLKQDSITVIDFKNFGGRIEFNENGAWRADGVPVKGGSKTNPYVQLRDNKFAVLNYLQSGKGKLFRPDNNPNLGHISGLVLFHKNIVFDNATLPPKVSSWFSIVDIEHATQKLYHITSKEIQLNNEELLKIPESLGLKPYKFRPNAPEVIPVSTEVKKSRPIYNLTDAQKKALREIEEFIQNKESRIFILNGAVNSGKTYIIPELANLIKRNDYEVVCLAPNTRQAARLCAETDLTFDSIYNHMYLFSNNEIDDETESNEDDAGKVRVGFRTKKDNQNVIYVIDEGHLISDSYYETENYVFGTGKLLSDFISYTEIQTKSKKIIVLGDDKQLMVGNKEETIMSSEHLEVQHQLKSQHLELDEVIQTGESNAIVSNAIAVRNSIVKGEFNKLLIAPNDSDVHIVEEEKLFEVYKNAFTANPYQTKVIRFSYERINDFNQKVKKELYNTSNVLDEGDLIHFHNTYFAGSNSSKDGQTPLYIANGDSAVVVKINNQDELLQQKLGRNPETAINVNLHFMDIDILTAGRNNPIKNVKIFKNFLVAKKGEISPEEFVALRVNFENRFRRNSAAIYENIRQLKQSIKEGDDTARETLKTVKAEKDRLYFDALRNDPYLNAGFVKLGYAISGHKAEGFSWDNVFVDFEIGKGKFNDDYYRWIYTSISRPKRNLYVFNYSPIHPFSNTEFRKTAMVVDKGYKFELPVFPYDETAVLTPTEEESCSYLHFPEEKPYLKALWKQITNALPNVKLDSIKHADYLETYSFSKDNESVQVKVYYKGAKEKYRVSKVEVLNAGATQLSLMVQKVFEPKSLKTEFDSSLLNDLQPFLSEFIKLFAAELKKKSIIINHLEFSTWLVRLYLSNGTQLCEINLDYNIEGFISSLRAQKTNSADIVVDVEEALNQIKSSITNGNI